MRACLCVLVLGLMACSESGAPGVDASSVAVTDAGSAIDAGPSSIDGGREFQDAAPAPDASTIDASTIDAATIDASTIDASTIDAATIDAATIDAPGNAAMSFFVTSTGSGSSGGNLGGLAGADAKCQSLASAAGAGGRTWRAYLSTGASGPGPIVDAIDRIGAGPWVNQQSVQVAADLASLHNNGILGALILDELGAAIPGSEHDILTGTAAEGTLHDNSTTCSNWTDGSDQTQGQVGHSDTVVDDGRSWNSEHSGSCDEAALIANAGSGRLYCFAID